jgi:hypothetical protein
MSQYMILIYEDEAAWAKAGRKELDQAVKDHTAFGRRHAGVVCDAAALEPTASATSIRRNPANRIIITKGPFAEPGQALGGYYLIEACSPAEAVEVASHALGPVAADLALRQSPPPPGQRP